MVFAILFSRMNLHFLEVRELTNGRYFLSKRRENPYILKLCCWH